MTYAFTFDASACSGCKACQVACKDKNGLPAGVLWRRVYEISGGAWRKQGEAWTTDVFAYNLSIACNHCVHPKCAGVCPTDAYVIRDDGIVYIDESKCMGCGYCAWACPYSAPRYNPELRHMTKCNFCYDNLDAGLPPACVAACPMRVLDLTTVDDRSWTVDSAHPLWRISSIEHPYPLPGYSHTEPHLAIQFHRAMTNPLEKSVSNWEEIRPGNAKSELPLVAFTLLGQMAAGMAILSLFSGPLAISLLVTLGALIGIGGLISLLHLGKPLIAWRALNHLRKSWLSREILMFGLFAGSWLVSVVMPGMGKLPLTICGIGLVYSMAQVYRLRSIPAWDTNRTLLAFSVSAMVLGGVGIEVFAVFGNAPAKIGYLLVSGAGLAGVLLLSLAGWDHAHPAAHRLRLGLVGVGLVGVVILSVVPNTARIWLVAPLLIITLIEEVIGRWLFYEHLHQRIL